MDVREKTASKKRLIDVNKVINSMQKCLDESPDKKHSVAYFAFETIIECLKQEPTVDAVEVVRCKDCKNYKIRNQSAYWDNKVLSCCRSANVKVRPEDFCSYGERKEGDDNG